MQNRRSGVVRYNQHGRTAQSELKNIIYMPQSEYNSLIGIEFYAE